MITKNKNLSLLIFSFITAIAFFAICHKSSPLYPMNDWEDVNCFFTVGKSMLSGMVPYRDLYEQKGPVLYFLYALASLISSHNFLGAWLIDTVSFSLFLFFSAKCAQLYISNHLYLSILILGYVVSTAAAFSHGGSVESLCLWMLTYSLFAVNRALLKKTLLSKKDAFFIGICAGIVLYIKFTMLGFFIGLALFVFIWYCLWEQNIKELLTVICSFLGGIVAVSSVVFAYFLANHALTDLFTVYFYNNLFLYPVETSDRILTIIGCLFYTFSQNILIAYLILLGLVWFILNFRTHHKFFTAIILSFLCLALGTYWGCRPYSYYGLIFAAFAVYGLLVINKLLVLITTQKVWQAFTFKAPIIKHLFFVFFAALLLVLSFFQSPNTYLMKYHRRDMPQYQFAREIEKIDHPTLLNYGFLDSGFYFAADVLPTWQIFLLSEYSFARIE